MKTTFLVKKNPDLPGREDNWIVMSAKEFDVFKQTPEGKERAKLLFQLDKCSEDDATIYAEVDPETFSKWRSEKNHKDYVARVNKEKGYKFFSYHGIGTEEGDLCGEDLIEDESTDVEKEALRNIEIKDLHVAIKKLSAPEQELIRVFYLADKPMTLREYEAITGIPNQTISDRKERAYQKLKKLLGY